MVKVTAEAKPGEMFVPVRHNWGQVPLVKLLSVIILILCQTSRTQHLQPLLETMAFSEFIPRNFLLHTKAYCDFEPPSHLNVSDTSWKYSG